MYVSNENSAVVTIMASSVERTGAWKEKQLSENLVHERDGITTQKKGKIMQYISRAVTLFIKKCEKKERKKEKKRFLTALIPK